MSKGKHAAVIGAGISGVVSMKSLMEEGFHVTCFEKMDHVGGLWRYHDDDIEGVASVMKTTVMNASKELGSFSDFPPPAEYANFMHHSKMYEYIKSYVKRFDGLQYIHFHHETLKVEKPVDYEVRNFFFLKLIPYSTVPSLGCEKNITLGPYDASGRCRSASETSQRCSRDGRMSALSHIAMRRLSYTAETFPMILQRIHLVNLTEMLLRHPCDITKIYDKNGTLRCSFDI